MSDISGRSRVVIAETTYQTAADVIEGLMDQFAIEWRGKRVLLKPNMLAAWQPERGVTTHPAIVKAVLRSLERRGAQVMVGDNTGSQTYGDAERAAEVTGLRAAAGSRWVNFATSPVEVPVSSRFFQRLAVSRQVLEADLIVNLPKLKTHMQTTLSGAVKNMFGILVGSQKARVHNVCARIDDFAEALVDIYSIRPPALTIMDAVVGMEGNGPSGGKLRTINRIIASEHGVAVDGVFAAMIGLDPDRVGILRAARGRGLGAVDEADIDVQGEIPRLRRFRLPMNVVGEDLASRIGAPFMGTVATPKFLSRQEACTRCGTCAKGCPRGAITLDPFPIWNYERCIGCYCCYELCEHDAIRILGRISRLFHR
ncbi:MAG: DUF362 domain-containing protein [Spirochaetia bacterium]|jgi:uncharacterized protein (DUF362 family)/Pyruvate/2-oxoacid:ferredoxin oxidoreductase delta subunit